MDGVGKLVTAGAQRAVPPEETWARVAPLLPAMGITRVAELTGLDVVGIPVFQAFRPNGRTLSVAQGKDPGLDRWCTAAERKLPDRVRTAKAAARALFPHHALLWHDPFLDELKTTGAHLMVRERLVSCLRFHRTLRRQRPTLQLAQLRTENILSHFAQRWDRDDLEDAVLERGFATVEDFVASARSFYLYDKAHPGAGPLVLQAAAAGDGPWTGSRAPRHLLPNDPVPKDSAP